MAKRFVFGWNESLCQNFGSANIRWPFRAKNYYKFYRTFRSQRKWQHWKILWIFLQVFPIMDFSSDGFSLGWIFPRVFPFGLVLAEMEVCMCFGKRFLAKMKNPLFSCTLVSSYWSKQIYGVWLEKKVMFPS